MILDKDEVDLILDSLDKCEHKYLFNMIKNYIQREFLGVYDEIPAEFPIIDLTRI